MRSSKRDMKGGVHIIYTFDVYMTRFRRTVHIAIVYSAYLDRLHSSSILYRYLRTVFGALWWVCGTGSGTTLHMLHCTQHYLL